MAVFLVTLTACVGFVGYYTPARETMQDPAILYSALGVFVVTFLAILVMRLLPEPASTLKIVTVALFGLSTIFLLTAGSSYAEPGSVMMALLVSVVLFTVLSITGLLNPLSEKAIAKWTLPIFATLLCVITVLLVNIFMGIAWLDLTISLIIVVLFSFLIVYDVSLYTKHCLGDNCCLDGTVDLWLDFANIFSAAIRFF